MKKCCGDNDDCLSLFKGSLRLTASQSGLCWCFEKILKAILLKNGTEIFQITEIYFYKYQAAHLKDQMAPFSRRSLLFTALYQQIAPSYKILR